MAMELWAAMGKVVVAMEAEAEEEPASGSTAALVVTRVDQPA